MGELSEVEVSARLEERTRCFNCGEYFPAWKRYWLGEPYNRYQWSKTGRFCSCTCRMISRHAQNAFLGIRRRVTPAELKRREECGRRLREFLKSDTHKENLRQRRGEKRGPMIRPEQQQIAAVIASSAAKSLAGNESSGPIVNFKVDGRLLAVRKGGLHQQAVPVVRLTDGVVFDYLGAAAEAVNGTRVGISEACNKGSRHRGHQFMSVVAWNAAGRPSEHPNSRRATKPKLTCAVLTKLLCSERRLSFDKIGAQYGVSEATIRSWAKQYGIAYEDGRKHPQTAEPVWTQADIQWDEE